MRALPEGARLRPPFRELGGSYGRLAATLGLTPSPDGDVVEDGVRTTSLEGTWVPAPDSPPENERRPHPERSRGCHAGGRSSKQSRGVPPGGQGTGKTGPGTISPGSPRVQTVSRGLSRCAVGPPSAHAASGVSL